MAKQDADTGRLVTYVADSQLDSVEQAYQRELACLADVEKKSIWLSAYMIHHANNIRPKVRPSSCSAPRRAGGASRGLLHDGFPRFAPSSWTASRSAATRPAARRWPPS